MMLDPNDTRVYNRTPYPFGIDPVCVPPLRHFYISHLVCYFLLRVILKALLVSCVCVCVCVCASVQPILKGP
jgi:hypothetical protein